MTNDNRETSGSITYEQLLKELVDEIGKNRSVSAAYCLITDLENWTSPDTLPRILGISEDILSERARATLQLHERSDADSKTSSDWMDFKWKLTAFQEIQDIFDAPLYLGRDSPLNLFQLWYFYFESRHLLAESIVCGLMGYYAASNALLRLVLEFSLLQSYYYRVSNETQSYKRLQAYFDNGIHPSWNTVLRNVVPSNSFCKPIKARLDFHLKALSKTATHAYHPDNSPRQHATRFGQPSLEGIFFWQLTRIVLQAILWSYYVNFPMLFQPRDTMRKFGFNGPVGILVDAKCTAAVEKSLAREEYAEFLSYSQKDENVQAIVAWCDAHPDLSDAEIKATWNAKEDGELDGRLSIGFAKKMAKIRAIRETLALKRSVGLSPHDEDVDFERLFSFTRWRKNYKSVST